MKNKLISIALMLAMLLTVVGCASGNAEASNAPSTQDSGAAPIVTKSPETQADIEALVASGFFSNRDFETSYDADGAIVINMSRGIVCDSPNVNVEGSTATITAEGTYILRGTATDGMLIIDAASTDKVQLVLDNVSITRQNSAPIYVKQADKVFITLAENSVNLLENGGSFAAMDESNIDAAIFSKDDLTLNGSGSLTVNSPAGHGIASNDSLSISGGSYEINCSSNGLKANDDICIADGSFTISSGKDAIHAEHDENVEKGYVYIAGGSFNISAEGDGLSAGAFMQIDGGSFEVITGGGYENAAVKSSEMWGQFRPEGMHGAKGGMGRSGQSGAGFGFGSPGEVTAPELSEGEGTELPNIPEDADGAHAQQPRGEMPEGMAPPSMEKMEQLQYPRGGFGAEPPVTAEAQDSDLSGDGSSMKGFKAEGALTVNSGSFSVNSADDAFHSDLELNINSGKFDIAAGDDALHAEEKLIVKGGTINITNSYEGMEALHLSVLGGDISITATDDGLNAAGGTDASGFGGRDAMFGGAMSQNSGGSIEIAGGNIHILAYGDGLDANGSIEISGGNTIVSGPDYGDTAVLDYYSTASISGGSFIGSGSSMMARSFSEASQGVVWASFGSSKDTGMEVYVQDSAGNTIMSFAPELDFELVIVSSPELSADETYSLSIAME